MPSSFPAGGGTTKLSWTTVAATAGSIDHGVGAISPVGSGSKSVAVTQNTTYTLTVEGPGGETTCSASVTVAPPIPPAPTCTLSANPTIIAPGGHSTLSWTTTNATSFVIDHGVGSVTPVSAGSTSVSPTATTTYTGTATGAGGSVICAATIAVSQTPPPPPPTCVLTANPTQVNPGAASVLSWTTTNAQTFSINQGIGSVAPVASGSTTTPAINSNTTYTGTATGAGGSVTCQASVTVGGGGGGGGPVCTLTANPTSISSGGTSTLTWTTSGATSFVIDNNIGTSTPVAGGSTTTPALSQTTTFTGTATGSGSHAVCQATVTVGGGGGGGGGGCIGSCGGGGGGGGGPVFPSVLLAALPHVTSQPLAYLYLSQIPYTGLDLGTWGTIAYWVALIGWSLAAAYLVLFGLIPWLAKKGHEFGMQVAGALNSAAVPAYAGVAAAPAPAPEPAPERIESPYMHSEERYSSYDGFKSFSSKDALTIDDIVKGLARTPVARKNVEPVYDKVEPIYENVEPIDDVEVARAVATSAPRASRSSAPAQPLPAEVPSFIDSLVKGDREACFSALRTTIRSGGDAEAFLTQVTCALDDAYRARLEQAPVHPEIARITTTVATPVLEKAVTALASAVDSSYSVGITGAKLALTRALAVLGA